MMRLLSIWVTATVLLLPALTSAQSLTQVYREPRIPSRNTLDRLNLQEQWSVSLPVLSRTDTIGLVQRIDDQLFVQLKSGRLIVLDAMTGKVQWRFSFPKAYTNLYPVSVGGNYVFLLDGKSLTAFNRRVGTVLFDQDLPSTPSAGTLATEQTVYVPLSNNRVEAYSHRKLIPPDRIPPTKEEPNTRRDPSLTVDVGEELATVTNRSPSITVLNSLRPPFRLVPPERHQSIAMLPTLREPYRYDIGNRTPSILNPNPLSKLNEQSDIRIRETVPVMEFELQLGRPMVYPPLLVSGLITYPTENYIVTASTQSADKYETYDLALGSTLNAQAEADSSRTRIQGAELAAAPTALRETVYAPLADGSVVSVTVDPEKGQLIFNWRYTTTGSVDRTPFLADTSVYVAGSRTGITRLDRLTGERLWQYNYANRILAMNPKLIYAKDAVGKLHFVDRERGRDMSVLDVADFSISVVNTVDDRLYLAGPNGLLVCLHDRDFKKPVPLLATPVRKPITARQEPQAPKVEEAPKQEPEPKK